ncbi:MAG: YoaK family protein [Bryobacteraceae bacterium]|jgi:uncharacterized membrane protein YoaK (UPF0700 family)
MGPPAPLAFDEARRRIGTLGIATLLAAAGGFLDGFTWVGHGHVFANAMTGNVVLLGIYCFSGSWRTGLSHLPAILAFVAGVSAAQAMQLRSKRRGVGAPYHAVLALEIGVLLILSLLPAATPDILFTAIIAFAASVQVQTFREVNGQSYNSTFTTGNLRTLSEAAFAWFFEGRSPANARIAKDFAIICTAFLVGAAAGGYATQTFGNRALWCDVALLALAAVSVRNRLKGYSQPMRSRSATM